MRLMKTISFIPETYVYKKRMIIESLLLLTTSARNDVTVVSYKLLTVATLLGGVPKEVKNSCPIGPVFEVHDCLIDNIF